MRKFMMTLAAASLVLRAMALQADAQNGPAGLPALKNASPIVKLAGCRGVWLCPGFGQFVSLPLLPVRSLLVGNLSR